MSEYSYRSGGPAYYTGQATPAAASDEVLLQRIAQHDETALRDLYQRYQPMVASIAQRIVHDESTVDEVTQDVFQSVWSGAGHYQPGTCVNTWLRQVARFRAIDTWRSRLHRQRQQEECIDDPGVLRELAATEMGEETLLLRESVRSAIALLSPPLRKTVEMYIYRQLEPNEIADSAGISMSVVRRRLRYGLYKLRTQLADSAVRVSPELTVLD